MAFLDVWVMEFWLVLKTSTIDLNLMNIDIFWMSPKCFRHFHDELVVNSTAFVKPRAPFSEKAEVYCEQNHLELAGHA